MIQALFRPAVFLASAARPVQKPAAGFWHTPLALVYPPNTWGISRALESKGSQIVQLGDAFAELFRRYQQPIYGFFRRRVTDAGRAEELAQETFLALLRGAASYEPRALFRTYLYAIGLRILRAERRKAAFRAALLGQLAHSREPTGHDTADAGLWVRRAVEKLDRIDREVLLLREYEQLSYAEIADLLHIPVNTVRSRLFRARTALRELLEAPAPQHMPQKVAEIREQP